MITIPGGTAIFGTREQKFIDAGFPPQQSIAYTAFSIDKYEVTNYQYGQCVKYGDCTVPVDQTDFQDEAKQYYPVVNINLYQASTYCRWLGKRLPTEVEWERAARGSHGDPWPWGQDDPKPETANMPWLDYEPGGLQPANSNPAGQSPERIYNLIGNVWEWTSSYAYEGGDYDPTLFWDGNPDSYNGNRLYAQRGGGWLYNIDTSSGFNADKGSVARPDLGVRCADDQK
jgi:formylglycine-generating enzyme required for sulfatase activity